MTTQPATQDSKARKKRMVWLILIVVVGFLGLQLWARTTRPPPILGWHEGRLAPCPDSPNCVCSQDTGEAAITAIPYPGATEATRVKVLATLAAMPRTRIVTQDGAYVHAECRTLIFGFVDDLELYLDDGAKVIQVRSASRLGQSDFGVNRRRIELLRQELRSLE
jgi:uncharacterized protein (DUF1499 family)